MGYEEATFCAPCAQQPASLTLNAFTHHLSQTFCPACTSIRSASNDKSPATKKPTFVGPRLRSRSGASSRYCTTSSALEHLYTFQEPECTAGRALAPVIPKLSNSTGLSTRFTTQGMSLLLLLNRSSLSTPCVGERDQAVVMLHCKLQPIPSEAVRCDLQGTFRQTGWLSET